MRMILGYMMLYIIVQIMTWHCFTKSGPRTTIDHTSLLNVSYKPLL